MTKNEIQNNEDILVWIDSVGGGFAWEDEIFAVTLLDVELDDAQVLRISGLVGVKQIALNAHRLSIKTLLTIASISDLKSLVLSMRDFSRDEKIRLEELVPEVLYL